MNIRWDQIDSLVEISIGTAAVIALLAAGALLRRRYAMRWRVLAWMLVAVRLLIPVHLGSGLPSVEIPIRPVPSAASVPESVSSVPAAAQHPAQPDSAAESGSASASGTGDGPMRMMPSEPMPKWGWDSRMLSAPGSSIGWVKQSK